MLHNKHTIVYIMMNETTKFISHMCHELQLFVLEKLHYLEVTTHSKEVNIFIFLASLSLSISQVLMKGNQPRFS